MAIKPIRGIDVKGLEEKYGSDEVFQNDLIRTFLKSSHRYVRAIQSSLFNLNAEEATILVCQLKGIANRCHAVDIIRFCTVLEEQLEVNDFRGATATLDQLKGQLQQIKEHYQDIFPRIGDRPAVVLEKESGEGNNLLKEKTVASYLTDFVDASHSENSKIA